MVIYKSVTLGLGLLVSIVSCKTNSLHSPEYFFFNQASWIIGTWEQATKSGPVYESWNQNNDQHLTGKSYSLLNQDTVVFETIEIKFINNILHYIPRVSSQNNSESVFFQCSTIDENHMIFENINHDFPQMIEYKRIGMDSLLATISGFSNNQPKKIYFAMKRL